MNPIYTNTIPQSADSVIYVLELPGANGDLSELVNDSVGLIGSTGPQVGEEKLKEDDPCDDEIIVQEAPTRNQEVPLEDPCPDGYSYNYETGECERREQIKLPTDPLDDADSAVGDTQPEGGQSFQDTPATQTPMPTSAAALPEFVAPNAFIPASEQQQGYFIGTGTNGGDDVY